MTDHRIHEDAFNLLCGEKLGSGSFRDVFLCAVDHSLVVKVEHGSREEDWRQFHNFREWLFWESEYEKSVRKWLAPCIKLSPDGRLLLQKRVEPLRPHEYPKKLPAFMTDLRINNLGWFEGRVVACDYAYTTQTSDSTLKNVKWDSSQRGSK